MTPHKDKYDALFSHLKQTSELSDQLGERIRNGRQFTLAWLMLAEVFRKNNAARVVPNDLLKKHNGLLRKPLFFSYINDMCTMNHLVKVVGTGTSKSNPLMVIMKDPTFIHDDHFLDAEKMLGEKEQHEGG